MTRSIEQYLRFLSSGAIVGLASLAIFELLRYAFASDETWVHIAVVSTAYFLGALLSYRFQQSFVFRHYIKGGITWFLPFFGICICVSLIVGLVSAALLPWFSLHSVLSRYAPLASLVAAVLIVSPISFAAVRVYFSMRMRR